VKMGIIPDSSRIALALFRDKAFAVRERLASYQVVGKVIAYQAYDG
jgi:hypothetical protein